MPQPLVDALAIQIDCVALPKPAVSELGSLRSTSSCSLSAASLANGEFGSGCLVAPAVGPRSALDVFARATPDRGRDDRCDRAPRSPRWAVAARRAGGRGALARAGRPVGAAPGRSPRSGRSRSRSWRPSRRPSSTAVLGRRQRHRGRRRAAGGAAASPVAAATGGASTAGAASTLAAARVARARSCAAADGCRAPRGRPGRHTSMSSGSSGTASGRRSFG